MTPSQDIVIGRLFLVIGVVFSALFISTFLTRQFYTFSIVDIVKQKKELKEVKGIAKNMGISIAVYILGVIIAFLLVWILIFAYFVFFSETNIEETFARTSASFSNKFWLQGHMLFAYTPLLASTVLVFTLFMFLFMSNKDILTSFKFAPMEVTKKQQENDDGMEYTDDDMLGMEEEEDNTRPIATDVERFQRHVLLLIFLSAMFVYIIILIPLWSVDKFAFAFNMILLFAIIVCTLATYHKKKVAFILYILLAIGYLKSLTAQS